MNDEDNALISRQPEESKPLGSSRPRSFPVRELRAHIARRLRQVRRRKNFAYENYLEEDHGKFSALERELLDVRWTLNAILKKHRK